MLPKKKQFCSLSFSLPRGFDFGSEKFAQVFMLPLRGERSSHHARGGNLCLHAATRKRQAVLYRPLGNCRDASVSAIRQPVYWSQLCTIWKEPLTLERAAKRSHCTTPLLQNCASAALVPSFVSVAVLRNRKLISLCVRWYPPFCVAQMATSQLTLKRTHTRKSHRVRANRLATPQTDVYAVV